MRKGLYIAAGLAVAGVVVVCALGRSRPHAPEPVFAGHPLSVWLDKLEACELVGMDSPQGRRARDVMDQMGTNALPTLVHMLGARESRFTVKLVELARKQPWVKIHYRHATLKNLLGAQWLETMGPRAAPAVPDLIKLYRNDASPYARARVAEVFGAIGPPAAPAIPELLESLRSTNDFLRGVVVTALGQLHSDPDHVVPALTKALRDRDSNVQICAADSLAEFGPEARPAAPALLQMLTDQDTREDAAEALMKIAPRAPTNRPVADEER